MTLSSEDRLILLEFAATHGVEFQDHGEIGFSRPCVGFTKNDTYIAYHPVGEDYEPIYGFYTSKVIPPEGVTDEYHKGDYLAVLVHGDNYDEALRQLVIWVKHLNGVGATIEPYPMPSNHLAYYMGQRFGYALKA